MRWLPLLAIVTIAACSRASDQNESKTWQDQAPPKQVEVPNGISIAVEVDGETRPALTTDSLRAIKPDFVDEDHRAWLITTVLADAAQPGTMVEAVAPGGVSVKIARPTADGFEPVLFLDRRGQIVVSAIDPKEPFPRFHGKGGRLHRAGDSMPHVSPVARLAITRPRP